MNNNFVDKTKVVFYGFILVITILVTGIVYSYTTFDKASIAKNPILETKFFSILNTFKKDQIDFSNISQLLSNTFETLVDTRTEIPFIKSEGRVNPFSL